MTDPLMLDPWFVTGFSEGEASFTFSRGYGGAITPYFAIKLSASDLPVLQRIQSFFRGIGAIYKVKGRQPSKVVFLFRVGKASELDAVVSHFDRYPLVGAKSTSFGIWRDLVTLKRLHFRRRNYEAEEKIAQRLSAASTRYQPRTDPR